MKNRKWFQACMAGVLSAAMITSSVSVWGADFSDGAEAQSIVEEAPVLEDENFASEAAEAAETTINSTSFPDSKFRAYVLDKIDTNKNNKLSDTEKTAVKRIQVQEMGIANLKGIEYFVNLEELYAQNNKLTSINLTKNTKLTGLFIPGNSLKSINLTKNNKLKNINISKNKLAGTLDLRYNGSIVTVNYSNNALTKVVFPANRGTSYRKYMKKIEMIDASHNKFTSQANAGLHPTFISPEVMPELTEVNASDNLMTSFNCNGYAGMFLDLRNNKIETFSGGNGGFQALGYYLDGKYNTLKKTSSVNFSTLGNVLPQRLSCNSNIKSKFIMVTPKLSASPNWDQVKLTVGASSGEASYKLERKTGSGSYKTIKTWASGELYNPEFGENEYIDTNVTAGTDYTYKLTTTVVVQDGNKKPTNWSKAIEKKVRTAPASPSITVKSSKKGEATISWKAVPGASGYEVYYGKTAGSKSATTRLATTSKLTYTKTKLAVGKTFYFRVRAYKTVDGKKRYGNPCTVKGIKIKK